jgi:hypothetical protein
MSSKGTSHLVIMFTVGPDDVAEGDRIFASHGEFMVEKATIVTLHNGTAVQAL